MNSKYWWQSKMLWVAVLTILGGIVEYAFSLPAGVTIGTIAVGIINIILRFMTNTAIEGTPGAKVK